MPKGRGERWVDPAPLEIIRPRLPWWFYLPWWVLITGSPILITITLVWLLIAVLRRVYRYPLLVVLAVLAVWSELVDDWVGLLIYAASVGGLAGLLWWLRRSWLVRLLWAQLCSECRRLAKYAPVWHRTMVFSDLAKKVDRKTYISKLVRVRADGWRDRLTVRLLAGQAPVHFEQVAEALAHSFGARSCRIRVVRPRRIVLDLIHRDPLARPVLLPDLPEEAGPVDLKRLIIGRSETGRPWRIRLQGNQILAAGVMGAGKASVAWSLLWALAPAIRAGLVQVFAIDPKGGMELGKAPGLFQRLVTDNGEDAVNLLEHIATLTKRRAQQFSGRWRSWSPASGAPFVLLIVDELADVVAYQPDRKLRERANLALATIVSQGRAPGVAVLGELQDPRKSVIDIRHLFSVRIALRLDEKHQTDMVLGEGVRSGARRRTRSTPARRL